MKARVLLALVPLLLPACVDDEGGQDDPAREKAPPAQTPPKEEPTAPPTGYPKIYESHVGLVAEIEKQEQALQERGGVNAALARNQLRMADYLIAACENAVHAEAKQIVQQRNASLRNKQRDLFKRLGEIGEEMKEIRGYLEDAKTNPGAIPKGFTEQELRDKLDDLQKEVESTKAEMESAKPKLKECEDLLVLDKVPPQEETLFTKELEALRKTRERAAALLR